MEIKVRYFSDDAPELKFIGGKNSNWVDMYATEDIELAKGEFALIPLGVAIELPEGYEALLAARSSTFKKWGIIQTNAVGIIDESYCGNDDQWMMPVYCLEPRNFVNGKEVTVIKKGDRVCQFRILQHMPQDANFIKVESLDNDNRGGFGSTGSNL